MDTHERHFLKHVGLLCVAIHKINSGHTHTHTHTQKSILEDGIKVVKRQRERRIYLISFVPISPKKRSFLRIYFFARQSSWLCHRPLRLLRNSGGACKMAKITRGLLFYHCLYDRTIIITPVLYKRN